MKRISGRGIGRRVIPTEPQPIPVEPKIPSLKGPLDAQAFVDTAAEEGMTIEEKIFRRINNSEALKEKHKRVIDLGKKQKGNLDEANLALKGNLEKQSKFTQKILDARALENVDEVEALRNELNPIMEEASKIRKSRNTIRKGIREEATKALTVPEDQQLLIDSLDPIPKELRKKSKEAREFLKKITNRKGIQGEPEVLDIRVHLTDRNRAFQRGGEVHLNKVSSVSTHVHEDVHVLEDAISQAFRATVRFRRERIRRSGTSTDTLNSKLKRKSYRFDEKGNEDDFVKAFKSKSVTQQDAFHDAVYTGKFYNHDSTEILTKGVELLFDDPIGFAIRDAEFFKFIIGVLDGTMSVAF